MPIAALGQGVLGLLALVKERSVLNGLIRTNFDTCSLIRIMSVIILT